MINEFPYTATTTGGTRTVFTLNDANMANGPTVVNTGDFSTYSGQLDTATGLLRDCPFRGDTSINLPVDFAVKNDIQPAIFPARGTQKVYTLWVELVESPFDLVDLINLIAVADPCQDHTYDLHTPLTVLALLRRTTTSVTLSNRCVIAVTLNNRSSV